MAELPAHARECTAPPLQPGCADLVRVPRTNQCSCTEWQTTYCAQASVSAQLQAGSTLRNKAATSESTPAQREFVVGVVGFIFWLHNRKLEILRIFWDGTVQDIIDQKKYKSSFLNWQRGLKTLLATWQKSRLLPPRQISTETANKGCALIIIWRLRFDIGVHTTLTCCFQSLLTVQVTQMWGFRKSNYLGQVTFASRTDSVSTNAYSASVQIVINKNF